MDFPFEADMPVAKQQKILQQIETWSKANEQNFQAGKWYFAGKVME